MARSKDGRLTGSGICETADFREAINHLKNVCPFPCRVVFRMDIPEGSDTLGLCELIEGKKRHFRIRVQRGLHIREAQEVLCHEMAHVLDWRPDLPFRTDHGPSWGVHYAEVFCCFFGVS